jgi:hypothetical protein
VLLRFFPVLPLFSLPVAEYCLFLRKIAGRGMGAKQLLAFGSSRSEPGYLKVSGGLLVNAKGVRGFIYQGTAS